MAEGYIIERNNSFWIVPAQGIGITACKIFFAPFRPRVQSLKNDEGIWRRAVVVAAAPQVKAEVELFAQLYGFERK